MHQVFVASLPYSDVGVMTNRLQLLVVMIGTVAGCP